MDDRLSTCPIWGTPATAIQVIGNRGDVPKEEFDSERTDGQYTADISIANKLQDLDERIKARLTTWLIDQRQLGEEIPEIDAAVIEQIKQKKDLSVSERADRLLRIMKQKIPHVGLPCEFQKHVDCWLAYSESVIGSEIIFFVEYLKMQGWLSIEGAYPHYTPYRVTFKGYVYLAELDAVSRDSEQALVAMWFDETTNAVWEEGIQPAIEEAGYKPIRIDRTEFTDKIDDQIIAEIRRSRFLVADFTHGGKGIRGSVYYEAGFAHGLDIPVIFSCRKDCLDKIHFDTRQYNHIDWEKPEDMKTRLSRRICAVIGDGPLKT